MATLGKLQITGIRSFGPYEEHSQQLKFFTPVTLILGQNGCGKTTIIEALKFVCSGDVPGGTGQGSGFVHDPKISKMSSTKGQIKLKLLDSRENEITVSRVVEVTQTLKSMKFNTKSATIRRMDTDTGEESSTGGRIVDVTAEVCDVMNVSPAVLNNVIFCHQENSLWPLDEGKKLKEKFDEIFDAQKYNKCTDAFMKHWKEMKNELKMMELKLEYNKEKKELADKMKQNLQDKENKLEGFENDIKTKKVELDSIKSRINEIIELEEQLAGLDKELTKKKATKAGIEEEQNTIKGNLAFEFDGTDEELRGKIGSFEKDRQNEEGSIKDMETRITEIDRKMKTVNKAMEDARTQMGKLREQKDQYGQKCAERRNLFEKAKAKLVLSNIHDFENNAGAAAALFELKTQMEDQNANLNKLIGEKEKEEKLLQSNVDKARDKKVTSKQNITSKEKEMEQCENKIDTISLELDNLTSANSVLNDLEKKIQYIDNTEKSLNAQFKEKNDEAKIVAYKRDIQTMEGKQEDLEKEYKILQQNDVTEGKMETEKRLIMEKQKEINRVKAKHSDSLKQLFDGRVPEKKLKDVILSKQRNADGLMKHLRDEISKQEKEVTTLEVQCKNQQEKIANLEKELKTNRAKISQACNGRDFNETLNSTFQKKERLQIDKGQYSSVRIIYGQYIKKFEEETPCCPVCETDFTQKANVVARIIATLKTKLEKVPQQLTKVEMDLQKEEALYTKLQQLKLVNEEIETVEKEKLPELKRELAEIENTLNTKVNELDEVKNKLNVPQKVVEISGRVISDIGSLDQNIVDVEKSERTIESLKETLVEVASKKSKQEIEVELEDMKAQVNEMRTQVETLTKNISNHKDRIQRLMEERRVLVEKQTKVNEDRQKQPVLEIQKIELSEKITVLREEINQLQLELNVQEELLKSAYENKERTVQRNKQTIQEQRTKVSLYAETIQVIDKLQQEIEDYLKSEVDVKLETTENDLKQNKIVESKLEATKYTIIRTISEKKENLAKDELGLRTLHSNVVLREKKVLERKLETEIQDLRKRIGGYNYRTVYDEKQRLISNRSKCEEEVNKMLGEKNMLSQTIRELRLELNKPENKKAHTNYMTKLYELKIRQHAIKDLHIFIQALERAVLEFHRSKMVQINRTIRQLWRNTYRGNDIDYIEIKTEYATGSATKRSYNYKVVQIKKGVELDMRGRCSAGQKVLACLLIRMALAETLSSSCGILALDEPTTNLDRANILSLSDTLAKIINNRYLEKTFQLIVITHDEEFLDALTRAQGVNSFYRVERDKDGYSIITRHGV